MDDAERDELLVRLDERSTALTNTMRAGFQRIDERFAESERALQLARSVWPTQKDVAESLSELRSDYTSRIRRTGYAIAIIAGAVGGSAGITLIVSHR